MNGDILDARDIRGANADEPLRTVYYPQDPEAPSTVDWSTTPTDPNTEPPAWTPAGMYVSRAQAEQDIIRADGRAILDGDSQRRTEIDAIGGEPPLAGRFGPPTPEEEAGTRELQRAEEAYLRQQYSRLRSGPSVYAASIVPTSQDPSTPTTATQRYQQTLDALLARQAAGHQITKQQTEVLWDLARRKEEAQVRLLELDLRTRELATERDTASPAQRALWGRYIPLSPDEAVSRPGPYAIGTGLPPNQQFLRPPRRP